jgi:OOP family OmpA-OmpF porin
MWLATTFMAGCAMVEQPPSTGDCCKTAGRIGLVSNTRVCENCPCDTAPPPVAQPEPQTFIVHYRVNHPCLVLSSRREVDQAVAYMRSHPASTATINGYTDGSGAERKRQEWLSHRRALVVARYMVRKGIGQDRLTVKGNGDSKPVADNRTEAGRARNRRVEIVVD